MHAQEVIVARETKPEARKQATPSSEQSPPESPAPETSQTQVEPEEICFRDAYAGADADGRSARC